MKIYKIKNNNIKNKLSYRLLIFIARPSYYVMVLSILSYGSSISEPQLISLIKPAEVGVT